MAVPVDMEYVRHVIATGLCRGPVLELGSRDRFTGTGNAASVCREAGVEWEGADIEPGEGVDFVLDILDDDAVAAVGRQWPTVLVLNLLEHVYDPISALRNATRLTAKGGTCVVISPCVWPLHDYPGDFWRPLPDFYVEFARRQGLALVDDAFCWLVDDRMIKVSDLNDGDQKQLPSKVTAAAIWGPVRAQASRGLNAALNTVARKLHFPYTGLAVTLSVPA